MLSLAALLAWLPVSLYAVTYTATQSGNWNSAATWGGGPAPGSTIGSGDIVNINGFDVTYNLGSDLNINGVVNVTNNGTLQTTGQNVNIGSTGELNLENSSFIMPIPGNGNFKNQNGTIYATGSFVQISQNFEDDSNSGNGVRTFIGGCLRVGENFQNKGSVDTYNGVCIEVGVKSSGNWENEYQQTFLNGTTIKLINGNFVNKSQIIGSGAAPHISALGVFNGNLENDGTWTANVLNFCKPSGSVQGSGAAQFNANVTNNNTPAACTAVNAVSCTNCVGGDGCTPSVSCKTLGNVDIEGCANNIPTAITDATVVFDYEACGATVTMSHNDMGDTNFCADGDGVDFTRTYTLLFDGVPQTPTCSQTIKVDDTTKPGFTFCPPGQNLGCNPASIPAPGAATATDNCDNPPTITPVLADAVNTGGCNWSRTRTYTATDACGNTETCVQVFTYTLDEINPEFTNCPTAPIDLGCNPANLPDAAAALAAAGTATDNCGLLGYDTNAGTITGTCNKSQVWTVTATDNCDNGADCVVTFTWRDGSSQPVFTSVPADVTVQCNAIPPVGNATASDACGTPTVEYLGQVIHPGFCPYHIIRTWKATNVCGTTATATQRITVQDTQMPTFTSVPAHVTVQCNSVPPVGTPTATDNCSTPNIIYLGETSTPGACLDAYILLRTWRAVDHCGNSRTATQRITVRDTQKPGFVNVPANVTVQCDAIPDPGDVTATDNCDPNVTVIHLSDTRTNGNCPYNYVLTRRWRATDRCGNSISVSQRITVVDNTKPAFTWVPANQTIECSDPAIPIGTPTATDNCDPNVTVTYLGEVCMYFNCPVNRQLRRTWKATDACGNWTTAIQTIDIRDTQAPDFTSVPASITIECSSLFPVSPGSATATDACAGYVHVVYNGQTSAAGSCPQEYIVTRRWTATDECGNSKTATQTITVRDTQAPTFNNAPADVTVMCGAAPSVPVVTASDNCDNHVPVTYLGETSNGPNCPYTITRTWTVADDCGNVNTHTQTISVSAQAFAPGSGNPKVPLAVEARQQGDDTDALEAKIKTVHLLPNPTNDWVNIGIGDFAEETAVVSIHNNMGQLIWEKRLDIVEDAVLRVNLQQAGAKSGLYTVSVRAGGQIYAKRLIFTE